jgi:ATP synthase protein I
MTNSEEQPEKSGSPWVRDFAPYLTIGMQLAIGVVAFFFLGRWLDSLWGTTPWLMVVGLILGTAGGFISFFRSAIAMGKKEDAREKATDARED